MQLNVYVKASGAHINAWRQVPIMPADDEAIILTLTGEPGADGRASWLTLQLTPSDAVQVRAVLERELQKVGQPAGEVTHEEKIERG